MQRITKKVILGIMMLLLLFCFFPNAFAASGYSFTVGTKYNNTGVPASDSTAPAVLAGNKFGNSMGFINRTLTQPQYTNLITTISGSRKVLQSDILYFVGHANSQAMYWDYLEYTGYYQTGVKTGNSGSCPGYTSWTCAGLGYYTLSGYVDLAVFMGCNTANGTSNIAQYTQSHGARATIGWTTLLSSTEAYNWTDYFTNYLALRYSVSQAVYYANSQYYLHTDIKNTKIYGDGGPSIYSLPTITKTESTIDNNKEYKINESINSENSDTIGKENSIGNIIKEKVNKDFINDDYIVETSEMIDDITTTKIYDYYFTINGIKTNIGYTVYLNENEDKVISIFDNMKNYKPSSLKSNNKSSINSKLSTLTDSKIEGMRKKALEKSRKSVYEKTIIEEFRYYNVTENKLYYYIGVNENDPRSDSKAILYYFEEI